MGIIEWLKKWLLGARNESPAPEPAPKPEDAAPEPGPRPDVAARDADAPRRPYYGAELDRLIRRYRESGGTDEALWTAICRLLPDTVLLTPIAYDGDPDEVGDRALHLTRASAELMHRISLEDAPDPAADRRAFAGDIARFRGGEGYRFATAATGGGVMHLRTLSDGAGKTLLCGFTGFDALNDRFHGKCRVAAYTFDEIAARLDDPVPGAPGGIEGLVINPGEAGLTLRRRDLEEIDRLRREASKPQ